MAVVDPFFIDAGLLDESLLRNFKTQGSPAVLRFAGDQSQTPSWDDPGETVLRAGKGFGKSHILRWRSLNHRESGARNYTLFYPNGYTWDDAGKQRRLVEPLTGIAGAFPDWLRASRTSSNIWMMLWTISIVGLLVWLTEVPVSTLKNFKEAFGELEDLPTPTVSDIGDKPSARTHGELTSFLAGLVQRIRAKSFEEANDWLLGIMFSATSEWANKVQKSLIASDRRVMALYLDNPDELIRMNDYPDAWVTLQQGLLIALWKLKKGGHLTKSLRVYCSIRSEAFDGVIKAENLQQALDLVMDIRYSETELKSLLSDRIKQLDATLLTRPDLIEIDPLAALTGLDKVVHEDRAGYAESIWAAILRHTRRIPREVMAIAAAIRDDHRDDPRNRDQESVRLAVNAAASLNVSSATTDSILGWNSSVEQFAAQLGSEVLEGAQARLASEGLTVHGRNPIKLLIRHGLLGYSEPIPRKHPNFFRQRFSYDQLHGSNDSASVENRFYFVHPALKNWIRAQEQYRNGFPEFACIPSSVIGDGQDYEHGPPLFRLAVFENRAVIFIRGDRLEPGDGRGSDPMRFLFAALYASKMADAKTVTLMKISEAAGLLKNLLGTSKTLRFPFIPADQRLLAKQEKTLRDYGKKICNDHAIKALRRPQRSTMAAEPSADSVTAGLSDREPKEAPFLTMNLSAGGMGAKPRVTFNHLDLRDVVLDDVIQTLQSREGRIR